jgi:hypothetical protein
MQNDLLANRLPSESEPNTITESTAKTELLCGGAMSSTALQTSMDCCIKAILTASHKPGFWQKPGLYS